MLYVIDLENKIEIVDTDKKINELSAMYKGKKIKAIKQLPTSLNREDYENVDRFFDGLDSELKIRTSRPS